MKTRTASIAQAQGHGLAKRHAVPGEMAGKPASQAMWLLAALIMLVPIVMIVLSLGGAALSLTGVVIGWRRLGTKLRAVRRQASPHAAASPRPP